MVTLTMHINVIMKKISRWAGVSKLTRSIVQILLIKYVN